MRKDVWGFNVFEILPKLNLYDKYDNDAISTFGTIRDTFKKGQK